MKLECVLFDLDGLLVDSEPLQFQAYRYAFDQFGIQLTMDDVGTVSNPPQRAGLKVRTWSSM